MKDFKAGVTAGLIYVTVFYLDKKFSKEEREIIEKRMKSQSECTAAIYDCSYYIYIEKTFCDSTSFESELRRIFTYFYITPGESADFEEKLSEGYRHSSIEAPIMSDLEFKSIESEIYKFTLFDDGTTLKIIYFREKNEPDDFQPDPDRSNKKPRDRDLTMPEMMSIIDKI